MKNKWAIIDDERTLNCELIARNGRDGIKLVQDHFEEIECLCMDHDLGDAKKMSGYDVLQILGQLNVLPDKIQLVTSNPVGRLNMRKFLEKQGFITNDGINFIR